MSSGREVEGTRPIFVFGSNRQGIHGAGAAAFAKANYGAIQGQGEGQQGCSYAIPTKSTPYKALPLGDVFRHVKEFFAYAKSQPHQAFHLTKIGCGLAGFREDAIATLFKAAPDNVVLVDDEQRAQRLANTWSASVPGKHFRVIVAGSRDFTDRTKAFSHLDHLLGQKKYVEVVCGEARGADALGRAWAQERGHAIASFPAHWDLGKGDGHFRNRLMGDYAHALVAFWNGESPGTKGMIAYAKSKNLQVRVIEF